MSQRHIGEVVAVHLESFPGFFLSFLGPQFLNLLYASIIASPQGVGLIYIDQGKVVGFVAGVTNPSGFYSRLIKGRLFAFGWAATAAALRKPSIMGRLFRALFYPSQTPRDNSLATLMSIGIRPGSQGTGLGKKLVEAFLSEMRNRGITKVNLTTDRDQNETANAFYQRLGFNLVRNYETAEHRQMNEYERILGNEQPYRISIRRDHHMKTEECR